MPKRDDRVMVPPCRGRRPRRLVTKRYHDTPSGECFVTFIPVGATIGVPTANQNENVSKRRVAEAKSARALFALATSGSSRYALLHASLVFVLRHAEVPGGWLAKRDGGIVPNGYIQKAKIPFHLPVR